MPKDRRSITRDDILSPTDYELIRIDKRQESILAKRFSRLAVGPHAMITFESWDSMWLQIQEMLRIEKGGEAQLADELEAYNPMVPNGRELTATLMFEIENPERRDRFLRTIGGIEDHITLVVGNVTIAAVAEQDVARTSASGKASAVHFLHFPLDDAAIAAWHDGNAIAMVQIAHPNYGHAALIGTETRNYLTRACL
ncbi:DUF3501 family protein [Blastomonas sp.]|uniref:DUF3501 family protein n=1 Tax=Blastomonas sp. TaxID=1909299 RepID=UPI0035931D71